MIKMKACTGGGGEEAHVTTACCPEGRGGTKPLKG